MTSPANAGVYLKSRNFKWLCSLAAVDVLALLLLIFPELVGAASLTQLTALRAVLTLALPVIVLVLASVLSASVKASLVYWRGKQALPGHEAFTRHAPADTRIDFAALRKNIGTDLPSAPAEQNSLWYKLYRRVDGEVPVAEAHRSYLLFRDMAAMSALLLLLVPVALYFSGVPEASLLIAAALFGAQYLATAIAARHSGVRFVTNVLAVHATRKVPATKPAGGAGR
jgi:hypothetical protein